MTSVHFVQENGPYAVSPESPMALAHWRKLRGLGLGLCISPDGVDGAVAVTGRSGGLVVLQVNAGPLPAKLPPLPPTWTVIVPGLDFRQLWYFPPPTGDGELLPDQNKPVGVTALRLAPLPGSPHASGARQEWAPGLHPWTMAEPAVLPLAWWNALPKKAMPFWGAYANLNAKAAQHK